MADDFSVSEIAAKLAENAESLCRELFRNGKVDKVKGQATYLVGDIHDSDGSSLHVTLTGPKRGRWIDWGNRDDNGDLIDLIVAVRGRDKSWAIAYARDWLGLAPGGAFKGQRKRDATDADRIGWARARWQETKPGANSPVSDYLEGRGARVPVPRALRYHPGLKHSKAERILPAMVGGIQDIHGKFMGIHRTYLEPVPGRTGAGAYIKAGVTPNKMVLGLIRGGAIRLTPDREILAVTEGIETGLSVIQAKPQWAVWCVGSVGNFALTVYPGWARRIILLGDGDAPGSPPDQAFEKAQWDLLRLFDGSRLHRDVQLQFAKPDPGQDFNDLLQQEEARL